jgi:glutamate synthase (NADPH/NADH)
MSLLCPIGPESNILEPNELYVHRLFLEQPIISLHDLEIIKKTNYRGWKSQIIDCTYPVSEGPSGLLKTLDRVCNEANASAKAGYQLLILSDRQAGPDR